MYVWLYYSILVSLIFPFLATATMTHRSLERRFPLPGYVFFWAAGFFIATYVSYSIVDYLYDLVPIIVLGPIQPDSLETSTVVCIVTYIITWIVITTFAYKGSWSSKLMVAFIYALICMASVMAIDSVYIHFYGLQFPDDVFKSRTVIHIIATAIFYAPLLYFLPSRVRKMISRTGGNMVKYLPVPIVLFCVYFGEFYHKFRTETVGDLDSYYTYLVLLLCVLSLILLMGNLYGSIRVDRYRRELDAATVVQNSCLPDPNKLPEVSFAEVSAHITPAREVGGDFYDVRKTADGSLMFVVADVSDKGIPAALFMIKSKVLLDDVVEFSRSPSECLDWLNRKLMSGNDSFMFVSMIIGTLSPSGELKISSAGHPSPLLKHNGEVSEISVAGGSLVGLLECDYEETSVRMEPGDSILMFTDGATDAENPAGKMFGSERLAKAFSESSGSDVAGAVSNIILHFTASADQSDDLTLLSFRYLGS